MELLLLVALAVVVGIALGLLGGGGSILMVPIFVYAAELAPKEAIASSLLVVAATSAAALVPHARAGNVRWRIGAVFGAAAMVGAFAGGRIAHFIPGWVLLLAFGGMMLTTAVAMLRGRAKPVTIQRTTLPVGWVAAEGVGVGAVTGMVGAGGGFLVVPALAVLGGLPMKAAIGTSLMVITMKSLAGFAGYASHVAIDYAMVAAVIGASVVGAFIGAALSRRISAATLRTGFGWFVAVMALYVVGKELPDSITTASWFKAVFVERWPWWIGGGAIGAFVLLFLRYGAKLLGVSTGYTELCQLKDKPALKSSWRLPFLGGVVLGGAAAALIAGRAPTFAMGALDSIASSSLLVKVGILFAGGMLVGYGARTAGGCTSGHSIVGVAQGARSSLVATAMFMISGFVVTQLVVALAG